MIFLKNLKFLDISMTGKVTVIFPGLPGALGTLDIAFMFTLLCVNEPFESHKSEVIRVTSNQGVS